MADSDDNTSRDTVLIARINALTATGRANWFALLGYIAFTGVTLLAVQDADFFLDSRQTDLPLVGVAIPTSQFFVFGPLLGTALYVYLHLYLLKLWEALAAPPPTPNGEPLSLQIAPWLIADFGLWLRGDGACQPRPMDWLAHIVTFLLAFLSGPLLIGYFWIRYWPAHQTWYAIGIGLLFTLSLMTMLASLFTAISRLRYRRAYVGGWWHLLAAIPSLLILSVVLTLSIARTEGPHQLGRFQPAAEAVARVLGTNLTIARANLREVVFTELPDDWLPYETHKRRFRIDWCAREGLNAEICGPPPRSAALPAPHVRNVRAEWCRGLRYGEDTVGCLDYFAALDDRFTKDWSSERFTRLSTLTGWSPSNVDLRNADLFAAVMPAADLRGAQMQGADLWLAQMEGADLAGAQMQGTKLRAAQMEGADLVGAQMQGTYLLAAQLEGADLSRAQMEGADLGGAQMEGAFLIETQMEGADLGGAQMEGANLSGAWMKGADLSGAQMEGADLRGAWMKGAVLTGAQMQGALLENAQMQGAALVETQMEGAFLAGAQMQGAFLKDAQLEGAALENAQLDSAAWEGARIGGSPAHAAELRGGTGLTQAGLSMLIGDERTLLPEILEDGSVPFVCSCWSGDPPGLDHLIALSAKFGYGEGWLRDPDRGWFCRLGERPRKTGTPWPLYTPGPARMEASEQDLLYWSPAMADRRAAPYCDDPASAE